MKFRAYLQCGCFFRANGIYGAKDGFNLDPKTGRLRVVVYTEDPSSHAQRPKTPNGYDAECFACKCRRASGRKEQRIFPTDAKGEAIIQPPVTMITCLIERQEECQE